MAMKSEWPELMGVPTEEARQLVLSDRPEVTVYVVPDGSMVTMDFRANRVRIFENGGNVVRVPRCG